MKKALPVSVIVLLFFFLAPLACGKKSGNLTPSPSTFSGEQTLKGESYEGTVLSLTAPDWDALPAGGSFEVNVVIGDASDLYQFASRLHYDPASFKPLEVRDGGFLGDESLFMGTPRDDGAVPIAGTITFAGPGKNGDGVLATVTFEKLVEGPLPLSAIRFSSDQRYLRIRDSERAEREFTLIKGVLR